MSFSIVILSRDPGNLVPCVRRIWEMEPELPREKIIVVDDGAWPEAENKLAECLDAPADWAFGIFSDSRCAFRRWTWRSRLTWAGGLKPFCFARNANIGIRAAGTDDVLLLNDDTLLETVGGFAALAAMAAEHPEFGIIASTCNNVGNLNQLPRDVGLREDPRQVCFVAVYIPRSTIDRIGLLDEELTGYGFDDDLYCLQVRRAGLKIGIWDGCYADHGSLRSSYRAEDPLANYERFQHNARIYELKLIEMGMEENAAELERIAACGLTRSPMMRSI